MRQVTIQFMEDPATKKFRVEVEWGGENETRVEEIASDVFKPVLDLAIRSILPKHNLGYGESGHSADQARDRAFLDRDIQAAGGEKEEP
jgi:hypothetical protein